MPLLDELATHLQTAGVGQVSTTLFKGMIPLAGPDALVALIEVPGMPPVHSHDEQRYEQPVIQVVVRGAQHAYAPARATADHAWNALDGVANAVLSGTVYLWIAALQSPFFLRQDELNRPYIVFSIRCARAL